MKNYPLLAKSINPKLNFIAVHMNKYLHETYGYTYDTYDKKTWAYYQNISGEPHSLNTDIFVFVLETSSKVLMTKKFKSQYPATYKLLMNYGKEYNDLVTEYTTQEGYIRGMLNPIDIDVAINAKEGDILFYNNEHIEWNEPSLIPRIENAIKLYLERWLITDYIFTDDLYASMMYSQIVSVIYNTIYSYRHTGISRFESTGYYQSQMLESNMGMFVPEGLLSHSSRLWLSKNAQYIATNVGKEHIFNLIIEKVLNPSGYNITEIRASPTKYIDTTNESIDTTFNKNKSVLYRSKKVDGDYQHIPIPLSEVLYKTRILNDTTDTFPINSISYAEMEKRLYENITYRERSKVYEIHSDKKYRHIDGVSGELVLESVFNYLATHDERYFINSSTSIPVSLSSEEVLVTLLGHLFNFYKLDTNIKINTLIFDLPLHGSIKCERVPSSHTGINYEDNFIESLTSQLFDTPYIDIKDYTTRVINVQEKLICELTNAHSPYVASVISYNYYRGTKPLSVPINTQNKTLQEMLDELPINIKTDKIDYIKEILLILEQLTGYKDVNVSIRDNLKLIYNFIIRLTSYTITPMLDDDLLNAINTRNAVGAITDTTTIMIDEARYNCNGTVPKVKPYGDDQLIEIRGFDNKDIQIVESDMSRIPITIVGENHNDRIRAIKANITVA